MTTKTQKTQPDRTDQAEEIDKSTTQTSNRQYGTDVDRTSTSSDSMVDRTFGGGHDPVDYGPRSGGGPDFI